MYAKERLRTAKRLEKDMGMTIIQQVENTITGEQKLQPVVSIGMPVKGLRHDTISQVSTLGLFALAVYGAYNSAQAFLLSEQATTRALERKRKMRGIAGLATTVGAGAIMYPWALDKQTLDSLNPFVTDILVENDFGKASNSLGIPNPRD
tara:strand:- start:3691 stop:4140 length:450 start_codon:yes stop_codon:yes gene_type:complete